HVSGAGDPRQPERAFGAPWMSTEAIRGWDDVYAQAANPCCPLNPSRYRSSSPGRDGPEGSGSRRRSGLGARHLTILVRWYAKVVRECPRKVRAIAGDHSFAEGIAAARYTSDRFQRGRSPRISPAASP